METPRTMSVRHESHVAITVLHYTGYDNDRGGIFTVIKNLAKAGRTKVVLGVKQGFSPVGSDRFETLLLPEIEGETISLKNFLRARNVAVVVRAWLELDPSRVFHGHSRAGLLVGIWLRWTGARRVVVTVHCYGRQRWFYRWAARQLGDRLFWLTPAMKRYYEVADSSGWEQCMPNGLPVPVGAIPKWNSVRPEKVGSLRIGAAGAIVRWKRWDLVLRALAMFSADSSVSFIHIGGTIDDPGSLNYQLELLGLTRELGLENRVRWLGWQDSSGELMRSVDVVVVPSDGEPFSMVALEALILGKPVIATRGGGPEDILTEGKNGWLVPAGDVEALAKIFADCLDLSTWEQLRFEPEQLVRFSEQVADDWAETYAHLCER